MAEKNSFREKLRNVAAEKEGIEVVITPCPKCNGERIEAQLFQAELVPTKGVSWSNKRSQVKALACTACGYTEFYTTHPERLVVKRPDK